jgi:hypothetical protein
VVGNATILQRQPPRPATLKVTAASPLQRHPPSGCTSLNPENGAIHFVSSAEITPADAPANRLADSGTT